MKLLMGHEELLVNFKGYETLSRNNGVDPKGLIHALDFINDTFELQPTAKVHPQPLRNSLLAEAPAQQHVSKWKPLDTYEI